MKIYKMNDCDWCAAENEDDAALVLAKNYGYESVTACEDDFGEMEPQELSEEEMNRLIFIEDDGEGYRDGTRKSFRQKLDEMIKEGAAFPCFFASTEY